MTRRFVLAGRVCLFLLAVAALASSLALNALPSPNAADSAGKHDATASNSPVFLVAPSISVAGRPAAMVVGDLNGDGAPDLVVANAQTGNVDVLLGDGKGKFQAPVHYRVGGSPVALVLGDLAGHGKIDIAIANQSGNSVSVLLGKGDGTFQTAATYTVGSGPSALAVGDFDGDGHSDLLIANGGSNTLAVLTNKGDGTFQSAKFYAVAASPRAIAIADFNGDGKLDIASGNADGTVSILLGDGTGRFNIAATMTSATRVSALVVGDFNRDGKSDLAVADSVASTVSVFLGRGDGTFQSSSVLSVGNEPVSLALEDVNADGMLDLLAVNKSGNTVSVMLGAGDGTFQPSAEYVVGNSPVAVAIADFNGDGHLDLATANSADGTVTVPLGNGDGTFQAAQDYRTHLERKSVAVGDLDGDGHPDVVVGSFCGSDLKCGGNGTASVFLSNGKGALKPASIYALGKGPISIALADVNGDKKLDLIAVNRDDGTVMVLLGNGDGTFQEGIAYPAGSTPVSVSVGDFNKDGKPDLVIAALCGSEECNQRGSVNVLLGNGDGSFKSGSSFDVGFSPAAVSVGDVDGDGNLDLVVANSCGKSAACSNGTASVLIGDGKGSFALKAEVDLGKRVSSVALADLNGDGKLDLIAANSADNQVGVLLGNGDGTFSRQVPYAVGVVPSAVVVADFDGDGRIDVAVANSKSSTVSLLHGNGDGTLRTADTYAVGLGPDALATLDLDGSGRLAVVIANGNSGGSPLGNDITVLVNAGARQPATTVTVAPLTATVEVNNTQGFTATVVPAKVITWSLSGANCVAAACGAVSPLTGLTTTYTAPASAPTGTVTLTATASDGATGTATITVSDFTVGISPTSQTVAQGQNATTTVTIGAVGGYTGSVTITCGNLPAGTTCNPLTITSPATSGTLTIVTTANTPSGTYNITVTGTDHATVPVAHNAPQKFALTVKVSVTVAPPTATVEVTNTQQFTATVSDANKNITWALSLAGAACSPTCGTLNSNSANPVTYTAPGTVPTGAVTLTATSVADPSASGTATITVTDFTVSISPTSQTVVQGQNATTTVTIGAVGGYTGSVAITCGNLPAGTTCNPLTITSPTTKGTLTIVTTANTPSGTYNITVKGTDSATVPVSHNAPQKFALTVKVSVTVAPPTATVEVTNTQQFTATVSDANKNITWALSLAGAACSPTCGTLNSNSANPVTYTAPGTVPTGAVTLTATSVADPTASGTATITVTDFTVAIVPTSQTVVQGTDATTTVTITPIGPGAYTGSVKITCSNLPAGAACAPLTIAAPGSGTLTIHTNTPFVVVGGPYNITVTGTDNAVVPVSHQAPQPFALKVYCTFSETGNNPQSVFADSGADSFPLTLNLTGGLSCPWTASSDTWIHLPATSGTLTSTSRSANLAYTVDPNLGFGATTARKGFISFTDPTKLDQFAPASIEVDQAVVSVTAVQPPTGTVHVKGVPPPAQLQFMVTVNGAHDTSVIWGDTCTHNTCGPLSPANPVPEATSITFTAPTDIAGSASPHTSATDTVSAASHVDPTKVAPAPAVIGIINDPPIVPVPATDGSTQDPTMAVFKVVATDTPTDTESDIAVNTINWGSGGPDVPFNGSLSNVYTDTGASGLQVYTIRVTSTDTSGATTSTATVVAFAPSPQSPSPITVGQGNSFVVTLPSNVFSGPDGETQSLACVSVVGFPALPSRSPTSDGLTCSFDVQQVTLPVTVDHTLTVKTTSSGLAHLMDNSRKHSSLFYAFIVFGLPTLVIVGGLAVQCKEGTTRHPRLVSDAVLALVLVLAFVALPGCGGGFNANFTTPPPNSAKPGIYYLTVTATNQAGIVRSTVVIPFTVVAQH